MLIQAEMRLPIDSELLHSSVVQDRVNPLEDDVSDTIDLLLKSRDKAFEIAEGNIKSAQTKQKETYDRKHQPPTYSIGSNVLLENTAQKQRKGGKLESRWLGPYCVNRDLGEFIVGYVVCWVCIAVFLCPTCFMYYVIVQRLYRQGVV